MVLSLSPVRTLPLTPRQREDAYLNFRWTNRTVRTAVLGFIVVPAAVYYIADKYYVRSHPTFFQ